MRQGNRIFLVFDFSKKGIPFYLYSYHRIPYESLFYLAIGHSDIPVLNLVAQTEASKLPLLVSLLSLYLFNTKFHGECAGLGELQVVNLEFCHARHVKFEFDP